MKTIADLFHILLVLIKVVLILSRSDETIVKQIKLQFCQWCSEWISITGSYNSWRNTLAASEKIIEALPKLAALVMSHFCQLVILSIHSKHCTAVLIFSLWLKILIMKYFKLIL